MSSHYEFHSLQANEKIQSRLQEAENHRISGNGDGRSPLKSLMTLFFPLIISIAIVLFILTGCTPDGGTTEKASSTTNKVTESNMASHILFQDALEAKPEAKREEILPEIIMADRIHFQDQLDENMAGKPSNTQSSGLNAADRFQFNDRLDS